MVERAITIDEFECPQSRNITGIVEIEQRGFPAGEAALYFREVDGAAIGTQNVALSLLEECGVQTDARSEERRGGKEC